MKSCSMRNSLKIVTNCYISTTFSERLNSYMVCSDGGLGLVSGSTRKGLGLGLVQDYSIETTRPEGGKMKIEA